MARQAPLPIVLFASVLVACGGSSSSPIAPDGYAPEPAAAIELGLTENRIAASEVGAVGLAFDLEEGQRQAIADAVGRAGGRARSEPRRRSPRRARSARPWTPRSQRPSRPSSLPSSRPGGRRSAPASS